MIQDILREIGFSEKETAVYLALLWLGTARAGELSKKTGIIRATVYDILDALMKRGIVHKVKKHGRFSFSALEPSRLLTYIDREIEENTTHLSKQKERVRKALPEFLSAQRRGDDTKVQFFEGEKGMREAYEDTLTAKEPIMAYANVQTMHEGLPNFFPQYYRRRTEAGVHIRAILASNPASLERANKDRVEARQSRFLPTGNTFSPEINIYNNKILVASWKEKMAVIIESKEFADFHRMIFERMWESLPKHHLSE